MVSLARPSLGKAGDPGAFVNDAAPFQQVLGQCGEVFAWVELGLAVEPDRAPDREGKLRPGDERDVQARIGGGPGLRLHGIARGGPGRVGVGAHPFQIAVDVQLVGDRHQSLHRVQLRPRVEPCRLGAPGPPQAVVHERVQRRHLRRGVAGDPGSDAVGLQHGDAPPCPGQLPSRTQARDTAAHHGDVHLDVLGEARVVGERRGLHPVGLLEPREGTGDGHDEFSPPRVRELFCCRRVPRLPSAKRSGRQAGRRAAKGSRPWCLAQGLPGTRRVHRTTVRE
ncbi:hypothetical protein SBADM41S_11628 [Streptomyces badius]